MYERERSGIRSKVNRTAAQFDGGSAAGQFSEIQKKAAPGVDGVRWDEYAQGLEERLADVGGSIMRENCTYCPGCFLRGIPTGTGRREVGSAARLNGL